MIIMIDKKKFETKNNCIIDNELDGKILNIEDVCKILNNYDKFEKYIESLDIYKSVDLFELIKSINYSFVRYKNTVVKNSDIVDLDVKIGDATGFRMELKNVNDK